MDQTNNSNITVGTTAVNISPRKTVSARRSISIRNSSTGGQVLSVCFSDTENAVANNGFVLSAGQAVIDSSSEGYECWQGNVSVISSAAGAVCSIFERVV